MGFKRAVIKFLTKTFNLGYFLLGTPTIITNQKGEILLGKRSKELTMYPSMWGLPGGIVGYKESIEDAIKREIKEEIGVEIIIVKYGKPFMKSPTPNLDWWGLDIPVYCKIKRGKPSAKDETSEIKWFKPKDLRKMNLAYEHKKILREEGLI